MFEKDVEIKNDNVYIFITINDYDFIINLIKEKLPKIGGGEETELNSETAIDYYTDILRNKSRSQIIGSISELIVHIILNDLNFEQHSCFFNLEERSLKKGFDGLYTMNDEMWLVESKSTEQITKGHDYNISRAMNDIHNKTTDKSTNNAWTNAVHHVKSYHIDRQDKLLTMLKQYEKKYINKTPIDDEDFNIIPSSTLCFITDVDKEKTIDKIDNILNAFKYKKYNVLCISNEIIEKIMIFFGV